MLDRTFDTPENPISIFSTLTGSHIFLKNAVESFYEGEISEGNQVFTISFINP